MAKGMLDAYKQATEMMGKPEAGEEMVNPASGNEAGDLVYIPKAMAQGMKKGQKVTIDGEVVSVGNKVGIQIGGVKTVDEGTEVEEVEE